LTLSKTNIKKPKKTQTMWPFKKKQKDRKTLSPTPKHNVGNFRNSNASPVSTPDTTTPFIMGMMIGGSDSPSSPSKSIPDVSNYDYGHSHDSGGYDGGGDCGGCDGGGGD
jgi:hypothetical protein